MSEWKPVFIRDNGNSSFYWGPWYFSYREAHFEFGARNCLWWFWYSRRGYGGKVGLILGKRFMKLGRVKDEMFSERENIHPKPIRFAGFSLVIKRRPA